MHPETPAEGKSIADLFRGREQQVAHFQTQIKEVAAREGLPYGNRTMTYNSRLAQELGSWADSLFGESADLDNPSQRLHDLLYRGYFVENMDISNVDILLQLAAQAGLDIDEARLVLSERRFEAKVDADYERARQNGVTGVPTFISSDLYVVGCQSYDVLKKFLDHLRTLAS